MSDPKETRVAGTRVTGGKQAVHDPFGGYVLVDKGDCSARPKGTPDRSPRKATGG